MGRSTDHSAARTAGRSAGCFVSSFTGLVVVPSAVNGACYTAVASTSLFMVYPAGVVAGLVVDRGSVPTTSVDAKVATELAAELVVGFAAGVPVVITLLLSTGVCRGHHGRPCHNRGSSPGNNVNPRQLSPYRGHCNGHCRRHCNESVMECASV